MRRIINFNSFIFYIFVIGYMFLLNCSAQGIKLKEEEIKFQSGDVMLAGTLFSPDKKGLYPAIIVTHGSGPDTRKMDFYRDRAKFFASEGFTVLIYDKRGNGDSGGEYREMPDLKVPAGDVLAAVRLLSSRPNINPRAIGVMGNSQGGWVGPLAASMSKEIAFVVSISGPGVTPLEQNLYQRGQELLDEGFSAQEIEEVTDFRRRLWTYYATGNGYEQMQADWAKAKTNPWFSKAKFGETYERLYPPDVLEDPRLKSFSYMLYDPVPVLENLRIPVLAVFGEMDRHIPVQESVSKMKAAFAKNKKATIKIFPRAGHGIQIIKGEKEMLTAPALQKNASDKEITNTRILARGFNEFIVRWLKKRMKSKN